MIQVTVEIQRTCSIDVDTDDLDYALKEAERLALASANKGADCADIDWNPAEIAVMYYEKKPPVVDASDYFYQMSRDQRMQEAGVVA